MILLTSVLDILRIVTTATADIEVHASWALNAAGTITLGRTNTASITTATTTPIVAAPGGASQERNVKHLNIRNNHGSTTCTVTVEHFDDTTAETLFKCSLLAGESLVFDKTGRWTHYAVDGGECAMDANFATDAQMETGTSLVTLVAPGTQHRHPGHPKVWCKGGIYADIQGAYNMTSMTDTGAGRATFNIATDFSSADYALIGTIEKLNTTLTVTNLKHCNIRNATQAAGSIEIECYDGTATTAVQEDPAAYHITGCGDQA